MIVCSKPSLPKKSYILRSQLMTSQIVRNFRRCAVAVAEATAVKKTKIPPLPPITPCTPSLSALPAVPAAVVPAVSTLSHILLFSYSAATTRACRASSCFTSSSTLIVIPCCFPAPCRGTRYRVCGTCVCLFVVTRTALSWNGDKKGVIRVPFR